MYYVWVTCVPVWQRRVGMNRGAKKLSHTMCDCRENVKSIARQNEFGAVYLGL